MSASYFSLDFNQLLRRDLLGDHEARRGDPSATGRRFRVLEVAPFDEEDDSPFVGLLKVEAV
jgi:hypothetical protein